ncbi:phosphohistidine phosphatase [Candidatus Electrothrix aarhusensis]|jgi:phosphohistidine phosphatase|uniref:Phosphohistidine phosphatase n=1 Tax=Candidatus Electrothrix aarhusensis TaxID=1859131 RepID=A0A444IRW0_9BACT|nr:phosphohistidine phosphatase [Candidatus Electrothrix aarhusensis]
MKKIHLIRHAKSSWKDDSLTDIARPLNKRGKKTCRFMAQYITDAGCCFDHIFCSPAARAQSTIERISKSLNLDLQWQTAEQLYTFDSEFLFDWCRELDESITEPLIIGHNPALTDFCNEVSNSTVKNIPTCGYAQLSLSKDCSWQELAEGAAKLAVFLRPKKMTK